MPFHSWNRAEHKIPSPCLTTVFWTRTYQHIFRYKLCTITGDFYDYFHQSCYDRTKGDITCKIRFFTLGNFTIFPRYMCDVLAQQFRDISHPEMRQFSAGTSNSVFHDSRSNAVTLSEHITLHPVCSLFW